MPSRMDRCHHILSTVSNLSLTETDELFKILASTKCQYSQNDNGIFINLRWVDDNVLHKIEHFMDFCNKNRIELEKYERLRKILTENFASKGTSTSATNTNVGLEEEPAATDVVAQQVPNIVGGMTTLKFNLLKKKFAKPYSTSGRFEQGDLVKEPTLIAR